MANSTDKYRSSYHEKIKHCQDAAKTLLLEEESIRQDIESKKPGSAVKRLELAELLLDIASHYLVINGISQSMHSQKDESALNDARKTLYRSIICLEEQVSDYIDVPYTDYENKLAAIEKISPAKRYALVQKLGLVLDLLQEAYGDKAKLKWTFVELEGRFAAVAKNLINLRDVITNSDPHSPNHEPTILHLRLVRKLLMEAADGSREKYEMTGSHTDDFQKGINFLSALKRLNVLTGKQLDVAAVQKKLDVWTNRLAAETSRNTTQ
jgi:hypothetical protein